MSTYTDRRLELETVKDLTAGVDFGGHGFGCTEERRSRLEVGREYLVEFQGFNRITGMAIPSYGADGHPEVSVWLWRDSDEDLAQEHVDYMDRVKAERESEWEKNRSDWAIREASLPAVLRERLERFRSKGGHEFETSGWGYELAVSELVVLYRGIEDNPEEAEAKINAYAKENGTSGNQHDFAQMLARSHFDDIMLAPSALTVLTGNPDYSTTVGDD